MIEAKIEERLRRVAGAVLLGLADKGSVSSTALAATGGFLFGLSGATPGSPGPLRLGGCGGSEARRRRYRRLAGVEAEDWSPSTSGPVAATYRPSLYREELTPRLGSAVNALDRSVVDNSLPMILLERPRVDRIFLPELRNHRIRCT